MKRTESIENHDSDHDSMIVQIDSLTTSAPAGSRMVYRDLLLPVGYHFVESLKIFLKTTALIAELLRNIFVRLDQYHRAPSKAAQNSWLGFPILGSAALLGVGAEILNCRYAKKNKGQYLAAQDYLYSLFSCVFFYYGFDLLSTDANKIPLSVFSIVSAMGLVMVGALFFKYASVDSSSHITCPWSTLFRPVTYVTATVTERAFNAAKSMKDTALTIVTLMSVINRELHGKTVSMPTWQLELIPLFLIAAAKIGYMMTDHPKFFQGFTACLKLLEDGALSYATLSGIFFMLGVYQCDGKTFCLNEASRLLLTHVAFLISFATGLYSAATTAVRFEERHQSNEKMINTILALPETIREKKTIVCDAAARFFSNAKKKVSDYCADSLDENNFLIAHSE